MNVKNPQIIWASVAIIFMLIAAAVILTVLDKDVTVILTIAGLVGIPVLGGFGAAVYQKMDSVEGKVNGRYDDMMRHIRELSATVKELALQVPVQQPRPEEDPDKTTWTS